jgi:hypothetical protein
MNAARLLGSLISVGLICSCSGLDHKGSEPIPANHRAVGSLCPQLRGPGVSSVPDCSAQYPGLTLGCARDSDCASGPNGRCLHGGGPACSGYGCSYDECGSDADCPGNIPCACRSSDSDSRANTCATQSNCRTDGDCGPGVYCSPSLVGNTCTCASESFCQPGEGSCSPGPCLCSGTCGHGYFCHTPRDSCLDDSDCTSGTCNFDLASGSWMCTACTPML